MTAEFDSSLVLDSVPALVWNGTPDGAADFLNSAWLHVTGRPLAELLGFGWQRALHPDDLRDVQALCAQAHRAAQGLRCQMRILDADDRYQVYLLSLGANGASGREPGGFAAVAIQLCGSEACDEAGDAEDAAIRKLYFPWGHVPVMVWSARADGYLDFVNDRWVRVTGLTLEQAQGVGWQAAVHPDDRERFVKVWLDLVANGVEGSCECRLGNAQRGYRWVMSVANPLRNAAGHVLRWYGAILDIEDRKRAEDALQDAYDNLAHATRVATLGELTASIAHEVSQPLAAIAANGAAALRWLNRATPNLDEGGLAIARMIKDATRATDVVRQLHALARKDELACKPEDVNRIIQETALLARPQLTRNQVVLNLDLHPALPQVEVRAVQLQQVLINLMTNGSQSMNSVFDRQRVLTVSSAVSELGGVRIVVRDVGTGISARDQEQMFVPFFTTRHDGMGMGLSICRTIIESHGGTIEVHNNDGPGVQLIVDLPAAVRYGQQAERE
jgi:PAS domain S-box-containing protein